MKFLLVAVFLLASSLNVDAQGLPLADAMHEFRSTWALHNWGFIWSVRIGSDADTCALANQLNTYFDAAFLAIEAHPLSVEFKATMVAANVPWDEFKNTEMKPALGVHPIVTPCTTINSGGVPETRRLIDDAFFRNEIENSAAALRGASAEFNDLFTKFEQNQAAMREIRCHPDVQVVYDIYAAHDFDINMIVDFVKLMFGFDIVGPC